VDRIAVATDPVLTQAPSDLAPSDNPPPSRGPIRHAAARISVALRVGNVLIGAPMALFAAVPPVDHRWLGGVLGGYAAWVGVYTPIALRRGLVAPLVAMDVAVTVAVCLLHGHVGPLDRVDDGSSWVSVVASLCVISLPLAWTARASIPAGLLIVVAFYAGFPLAGHPDKGFTHTATLAVQLASAVAVMVVLRRAAAASDSALAAAHAAARREAVDRARRVDERAQLRLLHDTALTTLTMVGTGSVPAGSRSMRARAATDLEAIEGLADDGAELDAAPHLVRLDELLMGVALRPPPGLAVAYTLAPCLVPRAVGDALAGGAGEALRNTARHARVDRAELRMSTNDGVVTVDVVDEGRGFDPRSAPLHRYGVRESIVGRMAAVGGTAVVTSSPDAGTHWRLEWRDPTAGPNAVDARAGRRQSW
jgi:signal transduction histidine kinase